MNIKFFGVDHWEFTLQLPKWVHATGGRQETVPMVRTWRKCQCDHDTPEI